MQRLLLALSLTPVFSQDLISSCESRHPTLINECQSCFTQNNVESCDYLVDECQQLGGSQPACSGCYIYKENSVCAQLDVQNVQNSINPDQDPLPVLSLLCGTTSLEAPSVSTLTGDEDNIQVSTNAIFPLTQNTEVTWTYSLNGETLQRLQSINVDCTEEELAALVAAAAAARDACVSQYSDLATECQSCFFGDDPNIIAESCTTLGNKCMENMDSELCGQCYFMGNNNACAQLDELDEPPTPEELLRDADINVDNRLSWDEITSYITSYLNILEGEAEFTQIQQIFASNANEDGYLDDLQAFINGVTALDDPCANLDPADGCDPACQDATAWINAGCCTGC